MNSSIDPIFNSYKVKFNIMNELFESNNIKFSTNKKVNVFINLDSLIRTLTSENILRCLVNSNNENYLFQTRNFISNIFNLAADYTRQRGIDNTPLRGMIRQYIDMDKLYNSEIMCYIKNVCLYRVQQKSYL